jgi:hypothetical protein
MQALQSGIMGIQPQNMTEIKMELVKYDNDKEECTLNISKNDFLDIFEVVGGVYSTASMQDFTALGVTENRVLELSKKLRKILREALGKENHE